MRKKLKKRKHFAKAEVNKLFCKIKYFVNNKLFIKLTKFTYKAILLETREIFYKVENSLKIMK